jgi:hypothetical protein
MARIEIWKCKLAWRALSLDERRALLRRLGALVERNRRDDGLGESGPFLVQKGESDLLVWSTEASKAEATAQCARIGLDTYFEPLAYATATGTLTARTLARKLSD